MAFLESGLTILEPALSCHGVYMILSSLLPLPGNSTDVEAVTTPLPMRDLPIVKADTYIYLGRFMLIVQALNVTLSGRHLWIQCWFSRPVYTSCQVHGFR